MILNSHHWQLTAKHWHWCPDTGTYSSSTDIEQLNSDIKQPDTDSDTDTLWQNSNTNMHVDADMAPMALKNGWQDMLWNVHLNAGFSLVKKTRVHFKLKVLRVLFIKVAWDWKGSKSLLKNWFVIERVNRKGETWVIFFTTIH